MSRAEDIFQKLIYFGEDAIDEFILDLQTEELFLDFKQAVSNGKNFKTLHKDDRRNLAKAISGFGNSEGGVIVWGVSCSRDVEIGDVAKAKVKVQNVHRFLSWLENAISGCTIPSHNGVRNHIISVDDNGDGFVATYIPKSEITPLMTASNSTIYIRSGSNNVPAPYAVIAGMFGKRPQPNIELLLEDKIRKPIENQVNETLYIMRLAKQEARRLGSSIVGSELILLGIILEANSIAAEVLRDLGVTIKDAREAAAKLTGINDDYNVSEITLSQRAKLILEDAWNIAKSQNKSRTSADNLLTAICNQPDSAAMKVLNILGTDALEIRQGIKNKLENSRV